jgi:hypothetical protein
LWQKNLLKKKHVAKKRTSAFATTDMESTDVLTASSNRQYRINRRQTPASAATNMESTVVPPVTARTPSELLLNPETTANLRGEGDFCCWYG